MSDMRCRILLVEDNPGDARLVQEYLTESDDLRCEVQTADSLADGLSALDRKEFDLILADLGLPDSQGIATFHQLTEVALDTPVIILTGMDDTGLAMESLREGGRTFC
ncbi:MAG: response regulator [Desulfarculaceae bacterium]|nr:response regulator [Desulfarculaceae bacterium]MCF8073556.1 response regulator [Desulfarculaceae bacterium]MCF8103078.1 response regulator [Desulfarculaceae bacterium]MCF8115728.1 response regulator [Desulfarculaceae bacterium]